MAKHMVNPVVSINGTDISDHVHAMTVNISADSLESTAFGSGWREHIAGLKSGSIQISYHNDFATSQASTLINPLLGSYATVVARPQSGTASATNPSGTAVCFVSSVLPIAGAVGDISSADITWDTHGTVTGFGL